MQQLRRLALLAAVFSAGCGDVSINRNSDMASGGQSAGGADFPVRVGAETRVFSGIATMLFDGPACTSEAGASADRWCGFVAQGEGSARNLFVVNVSQAGAGVPVDCGTPDPNCLLLTPSLGGDSVDPTLHGTFFEGDTLVYYDATLAPRVWRPGMAGGRLLAERSNALDLVFCTPATRGTAVACLGLPAEQPDPELTLGDLFIGKADAESEPLLAPVDHVIAGNAADRGGVPRFGYGFPVVPGGDYVAWTSRETAAGPELLKLQRAGDPASQRLVASDVHDWDVSPDGSRWFWLSSIDASGVGTLQSASFPSGAGVADIATDVLRYDVAKASGSIATISATAGLTGILDPIFAPASQLALDTKVRALLGFSDQGHVAYTKHFVGTNLVDLLVAKVDGSGSCAADTTTSVPIASLHFSPNGEEALWARSKNEAFTSGSGLSTFDGLHTRLSDCSSMSFSDNVAALGWLSSRTALFIDEFDSEAGSGTMRARTLGGDAALDTANTLIATQVDSYALTGPAPGALAYTVNGSGDADGVYVRAFAPISP